MLAEGQRSPAEASILVLNHIMGPGRDTCPPPQPLCTEVSVCGEPYPVHAPNEPTVQMSELGISDAMTPLGVGYLPKPLSTDQECLTKDTVSKYPR